jgi:hypothetical protein
VGSFQDLIRVSICSEKETLNVVSKQPPSPVHSAMLHFTVGKHDAHTASKPTCQLSV